MDSVRRHEYLKAMGITVWVPRDALVDNNTGNEATVTENIVPVASQFSVSDYLGRLAEAACDPVQNAEGDLLLVIEPPGLNAQDMELLGKMLGAIQLELTAQTMVTLSPSGIVSVGELLSHRKPKMVLVMVGCNGNSTLIDSHRQHHHQPEWCQTGLAITHHPAELITQPDLKRPAWEDLKRVKAALDG